MAKMGRPPIEIDWKAFDNLCKLQCTLLEFASFFDCSVDTIERKVQETHGITFAEYMELKRGTGKVSLRRKQYEAAMAGNPTMLVWLGKNWLDQKDKKQIEHSGEIKNMTPEQIKEEAQKLYELLKDE